MRWSWWMSTSPWCPSRTACTRAASPATASSCTTATRHVAAVSSGQFLFDQALFTQHASVRDGTMVQAGAKVGFSVEGI